MAQRIPRDNTYGGLPDIHMNTAKGLTIPANDIHMATTKGLGDADVRMETTKPGTTLKQNGFQVWERELIESPEVRRKATVAQLCECPICHSCARHASPTSHPVRGKVASPYTDIFLQSLPRLLLPTPRIPVCSKGAAIEFRRGHRGEATHIRRIRQGIQVVLRQGTRRFAKATYQAESRTIPHHRAGRAGWLWRGLLSEEARLGGGLCAQEDAEAHSIQDG